MILDVWTLIWIWKLWVLVCPTRKCCWKNSIVAEDSRRIIAHMNLLSGLQFVPSMPKSWIHTISVKITREYRWYCEFIRFLVLINKSTKNSEKNMFRVITHMIQIFDEGQGQEDRRAHGKTRVDRQTNPHIDNDILKYAPSYNDQTK